MKSLTDKIENTLIDKKILRKQIIRNLKRLLPEERLAQEEEIYDSLVKLTLWQEAKKIAITIPMEFEFNLELLVKEARNYKKQLFLPVMQADKSLNFVLWDEDTLLQETRFGVKQPIETEHSQAIELNQLDVIIVPGLAYSEDGDRVGFGGGYYDRTLTNYDGKTLSIAYSCQIFPKTIWPTEKTDKRIDLIISNRGVYCR